MPAEAKEKALQELKRLEVMPPVSAEATVSRNYLEWLAVPWSKKSRELIDIKKAERILDEDHYGLEKIKERILEFLAVRRLVKKMKGSILCFVGPPGVGRPRWPSPSPAPRAATSCASPWAACATRPRSAATGAPTSAPSPARSSR